jgi:hypothetical protein
MPRPGTTMIGGTAPYESGLKVEACPTAVAVKLITMTKLAMHRLLIICFFINSPYFII